MWQDLDDNLRAFLDKILGFLLQFLAVAVPILFVIWQTSIARSIKIANMEVQIASLYQNKADAQTVEVLNDYMEKVDADMQILIGFTLQTYTQQVTCEKLTVPEFNRDE